MATPITFNGVAYSVPAYNDTGYAQGPGNLSSYLIALASGTLQQSGGTFSLTSDVNFGVNFGLISKYFTSTTVNPATAGTIRLAKTDTIDWRNNANSGNVALGINGSDQLTFNGGVIPSGGGFVSSITGTVNQIIASSSTGAVTLSTPQDIAPTSVPTFGGEHISATGTNNAQISLGNAGKTYSLGVTHSGGTDWFGITPGASVGTPTTSGIFINNAVGTGIYLTSDLTSGAVNLTGGVQGVNVDLLVPQSVGVSLIGNATSPFGAITTKGALTLQETGVGTTNIQISAPSSVATYSLTMPAAQGAANTTLLNNGSGVLSFALIANANIAAAAAIAVNKLAALTVSSPVRSDASGFLTTGQTNLATEVTGILPVANGGTGDSSLTAYAVLCGGTTTTNPVQSVAGLGATGQVLTSNGAGTLPTFQSITGSGTVNSGTATHLAYYATSTNAVSDANTATVSGAYTFSGIHTMSAGAGAITMSSSTIAMGANKITGLANGTATTDAAAFGQIKVLQTIVSTSTTPFSTTSSTFQTTNCSASITPTSASNRIMIIVVGCIRTAAPASSGVYGSLFRGTTNLGGGSDNALIHIADSGLSGSILTNGSMSFLDSPATTSATTYAVKIANDDNATTVNFNTAQTTCMILMEVV